MGITLGDRATVSIGTFLLTSTASNGKVVVTLAYYTDIGNDSGSCTHFKTCFVGTHAFQSAMMCLPIRNGDAEYLYAKLFRNEFSHQVTNMGLAELPNDPPGSVVSYGGDPALQGECRIAAKAIWLRETCYLTSPHDTLEKNAEHRNSASRMYSYIDADPVTFKFSDEICNITADSATQPGWDTFLHGCNPKCKNKCNGQVLPIKWKAKAPILDLDTISSTNASNSTNATNASNVALATTSGSMNSQRWGGNLIVLLIRVCFVSICSARGLPRDSGA